MKKSVFNILIVGVGGQGIITASDIITLAAVFSGYDAKKSEIHGMSQRGGSVFSHIRFGKKIYSPVIPAGEADILLSLEEMETLRWLEYTNSDTTVIVADTRIIPSGVIEYPSGITDELKKRYSKLILLNTEELKGRIGNIIYLNVALIGLLSNYLDFPEKSWRQAIKEEVPEAFFKENWKAFISGKKEVMCNVGIKQDKRNDGTLLLDKKDV
ncbi:MAG: indolepyruvate oxidoreductase subunit beta [Spirochaetota bacterium]